MFPTIKIQSNNNVAPNYNKPLKDFINKVSYSLKTDNNKDTFKKGHIMNNAEKQVKLLNDYVKYNINFDELMAGREKLKNTKDNNDDSVDENIENLFANFDDDPYYTQTDFSYDSRELINIYSKKGKYSNILNDKN